MNCSGLFKVEFPRGNSIAYRNTAKNTVPVKITFKSSYSISAKKSVSI